MDNLSGAPNKGRLFIFLANVRLGYEGMSDTNTLAYAAYLYIMKVKSFKSLATVLYNV